MFTYFMEKNTYTIVSMENGQQIKIFKIFRQILMWWVQ